MYVGSLSARHARYVNEYEFDGNAYGLVVLEIIVTVEHFVCAPYHCNQTQLIKMDVRLECARISRESERFNSPSVN